MLRKLKSSQSDIVMKDIGALDFVFNGRRRLIEPMILAFVWEFIGEGNGTMIWEWKRVELNVFCEEKCREKNRKKWN